MKLMIKNTKTNTSSIRNHVLHGRAKKLASFLSLLKLWKTSQPDDASELSTDDVSRKWRKADEASVGGRFSYYLLPCHPYGYNHPKQREFEGNIFALISHAFTSLSLVDHYFFRNLTQDLDPRLHPVGR